MRNDKSIHDNLFITADATNDPVWKKLKWGTLSDNQLRLIEDEYQLSDLRYQEIEDHEIQATGSTSGSGGGGATRTSSTAPPLRDSSSSLSPDESGRSTAGLQSPSSSSSTPPLLRETQEGISRSQELGEGKATRPSIVGFYKGAPVSRWALAAQAIANDLSAVRQVQQLAAVHSQGKKLLNSSTTSSFAGRANRSLAAKSRSLDHISTSSWSSVHTHQNDYDSSTTTSSTSTSSSSKTKSDDEVRGKTHSYQWGHLSSFAPSSTSADDESHKWIAPHGAELDFLWGKLLIMASV